MKCSYCKSKANPDKAGNCKNCGASEFENEKEKELNVQAEGCLPGDILICIGEGQYRPLVSAKAE